MGERPRDHDRPAHEKVNGYRTLPLLVEVVAGIRRVRPVVAEDEYPPLRHGHLERDLRGRVTRMEIRLVERRAVDRDPPGTVAADHGVAAEPDDALDQVLVVGRRQQPDPRQRVPHLPDAHRGFVLLDRLPVQPAARVAEDDDVAALRLPAEPGRQLVHEHPVVDPYRLLHRAAGDDEGLHEERLQHQRDQQRRADEQRYLPCGAQPSAPLDALGRAPSVRAALAGTAQRGARFVGHGTGRVVACPAAPGTPVAARPVPCARGTARGALLVPARVRLPVLVTHAPSPPIPSGRPATRSPRPVRRPGSPEPCRPRASRGTGGSPRSRSDGRPSPTSVPLAPRCQT